MDLTENQIQELYNTMINLIESRENKRKNITLEDFRIWIIGLKDQYINDEETEEFCKYVEDSIYELVCY
jgi:hypothetical protein